MPEIDSPALEDFEKHWDTSHMNWRSGHPIYISPDQKNQWGFFVVYRILYGLDFPQDTRFAVDLSLEVPWRCGPETRIFDGNHPDIKDQILKWARETLLMLVALDEFDS